MPLRLPTRPSARLSFPANGSTWALLSWGCPGKPSGLVGTIYRDTQSDSCFMETPYFEKDGQFFQCHVDMWWVSPMWPKCAFRDQKGLIWKRYATWHPPDHRTKIANFSKKYHFHFILLYWSKGAGYFGSENGVLGCFGPAGREVADVKQRH